MAVIGNSVAARICAARKQAYETADSESTLHHVHHLKSRLVFTHDTIIRRDGWAKIQTITGYCYLIL